MRKINYVPKYDLTSIIDSKHRKIKANFSWYAIISTWFYVGLIPVMPGTFGSAAVLPIYLAILNYSKSIISANQIMWLFFAIILFLGYFAVRKYEYYTTTHDHRSIVVDEVLGMLLALSICFPQCYNLATKLYKFIDIKPTYLSFMIIFIIFRYFDIRKPLFIKFIDRHMTSSLSVILDDLLAGLYTALTIIFIYNIAIRFL